MKRLGFWKMEGAGNDFVVVREARSLGSLPALARRLCDRRRAVGADGLLVVSRAPGGVRMRYFNADGSRAFCGNGARCAAAWGFEHGWARGRTLALVSDAGTLEARRLARGAVRLTMPDPSGLDLGLKVSALGKTRRVDRIDTGVPHAVLEWKDLDRAPVRELGRALRFHRAFGPAGANVNFVAPRRGAIAVRTYERGVEDETLACGTGITAAALTSAARRGLRSPVRVVARSGAALRVGFTRDGQGFKDVWLEGPAHIIYRGETSR